MAHTPGPWHIETFESAPDKPFICASWGQEDPIVNDISEIGDTWANALLIADSPEILEALEALYRVVVQLTLDDPTHYEVANKTAVAGLTARQLLLRHKAIEEATV